MLLSASTPAAPPAASHPLKKASLLKSKHTRLLAALAPATRDARVAASTSAAAAGRGVRPRRCGCGVIACGAALRALAAGRRRRRRRRRCVTAMPARQGHAPVRTTCYRGLLRNTAAPHAKAHSPRSLSTNARRAARAEEPSARARRRARRASVAATGEAARLACRAARPCGSRAGKEGARAAVPCCSCVFRDAQHAAVLCCCRFHGKLLHGTTCSTIPAWAPRTRKKDALLCQGASVPLSRSTSAGLRELITCERFCFPPPRLPRPLSPLPLLNPVKIWPPRCVRATARGAIAAEQQPAVWWFWVGPHAGENLLADEARLTSESFIERYVIQDKVLHNYLLLQLQSKTTVLLPRGRFRCAAGMA